MRFIQVTRCGEVSLRSTPMPLQPEKWKKEVRERQDTVLRRHGYTPFKCQSCTHMERVVLDIAFVDGYGIHKEAIDCPLMVFFNGDSIPSDWIVKTS